MFTMPVAVTYSSAVSGHYYRVFQIQTLPVQSKWNFPAGRFKYSQTCTCIHLTKRVHYFVYIIFINYTENVVSLHLLHNLQLLWLCYSCIYCDCIPQNSDTGSMSPMPWHHKASLLLLRDLGIKNVAHLQRSTCFRLWHEYLLPWICITFCTPYSFTHPGTWICF